MTTTLDVCPFEVLGVTEEASDSQRKAAYRREAKRHHPDLNGGDQATFVGIQRAWDLVRDPAFRVLHATGSACPCRPTASSYTPPTWGNTGSGATSAPSSAAPGAAAGRVVLTFRDLWLLLGATGLVACTGYVLLAVPCALVAAVVAVLLVRGEQTGWRAGLAKVATIFALTPVVLGLIAAAVVVLAVSAIVALVLPRRVRVTL